MSPSSGAFLASGAFIRNPLGEAYFHTLHLPPPAASGRQLAMCYNCSSVNEHNSALSFRGVKQVLTPWNVLLLPLNLAEVNGPLLSH